MLDLSGCRAKIDRAREHFDALDSEIQAFVDSGAYGVWGELDEQSGWKVVAFDIHKSPPIRWSVIVGDFAHNLRSSLDHLVYQLSGRRDGTAFPIFSSSEKYRQPKCDRGVSPRETFLRGVEGAHRTIIDQYQPYQRVGDKRRDPLAQLAWLNNADKHRIVHARFTELGESREDVPCAVEFRRRSRCDRYTAATIAASSVGVCAAAA